MGSARTSQLGFVDEVTPGLVVTPSLFLPEKGGGIIATDGQTESEAQYAGRFYLDESQSNGGNIEVGGNIDTEFTNRGMGFFLKHAIGPGTVNTTGSGPYTHVITPGPLDGYAFTTQQGIEDDAGVVQPITSTGCKMAELDLSWDVGEIVGVSADIIAMRQMYGVTVSLSSGATTSGSRDVTVGSGASEEMVGALIAGTGIPAGSWITDVISSTAIRISAAASATNTGLTLTVGKELATASYSTLKPYKAMHTTVSLAGSEIEALGGSVNFKNPVEARFRSGSRWSKEPKENIGPGSKRETTGTFEIEHNAVVYKRYLKGQKFAIQTLFSNGVDSVTIAANGRITAAPTPVFASGASRNMMSVAWKAMGTTDPNALTVTIVSAESTI